MEFNGNKGNWTFKESEINEDCFTIWGFCERIAELNFHTSLSNKKLAKNLKKKAESNAKLISKAPEMLEMLVDIRDFIDKDINVSECRTQIDELIKEATTI